jgi:hypothetical protein
MQIAIEVLHSKSVIRGKYLNLLMSSSLQVKARFISGLKLNCVSLSSHGVNGSHQNVYKRSVDISGMLLVRLIAEKEEPSTMETFSRLIGTLTRKNGKKIRSALASENSDDGPEAKAVLKGEVSLNMSSLAAYPSKIREKCVILTKDDNSSGQVVLKCVFVPAYRKGGVCIFDCSEDKISLLK